MRQQRNDVIQRAAQREGNAFQNQLARLKFGEVEYIIDDSQQIVSRAFNGIQVIALRGVELGF
jgi:hypothetical protein